MKKLITSFILVLASQLSFAETSKLGGPKMQFNEGNNFTITLNGWAAGINSKFLWYDDGDVIGGAELGGSHHHYLSTAQLLDNTDGLLLNTFRFEMDRWSFNVDLTWVSLEGDTSKNELGKMFDLCYDDGVTTNCDRGPGVAISVNEVDVVVDHDTTYLTADIGYALTPELEVFVGIRWTSVDTVAQLDAAGTYCIYAIAPCDPSGGTAISAGIDLIDSDNDWYDPMIGLRYMDNVSDLIYVTAEGDIAGLVGVQYAFQLRGAVGINLSDNLKNEIGYRLFKYHANDDDVRYTQINEGFEARFLYTF